MSALGHKRTSQPVRPMSALPPKAGITERDPHVRFVPKADIQSCGRKLSELSGEVWPEAERKLWFQMLEGSFKLIYKEAANWDGLTRLAAHGLHVAGPSGPDEASQPPVEATPLCLMDGKLCQPFSGIPRPAVGTFESLMPRTPPRFVSNDAARHSFQVVKGGCWVS
jgi:hypothetical protein